MYQASRVMTKSLILLPPEMPAIEAMRVLLRNQISGGPVVDSDGNLVGIISEFALLGVVIDETTEQTPIEKLMTQDVVTVDVETPLCDVVQAFLSLRIRRLPVLDNGKLVGQISRRDVLRCIASNTNDGDQLEPRNEIVHPAEASDNEPEFAAQQAE